MKIQQQNNYNPNMKALYFTKTMPMRSKIVNYLNQKVTETGIKYVEEKSAILTPVMKESLSRNSFIKNLSDKFDVFIQYLGERLDNTSSPYTSSTYVHVVRNEKDSVLSDSYFFSASDRFSPDGARLQLLTNIANEQYTHKTLYKLCE